jgi:hypothetical protein
VITAVRCTQRIAAKAMNDADQSSVPKSPLCSSQPIGPTTSDAMPTVPSRPVSSRRDQRTPGRKYRSMTTNRPPYTIARKAICMIRPRTGTPSAIAPTTPRTDSATPAPTAANHSVVAPRTASGGSGRATS